MLERWLILSDGSKFKGYALGSENFQSGEIVFHTGMTGYMESFTDPSFKGQLLCLTYPSIGNYGVDLVHDNLQSNNATIAALIVSDCSEFNECSDGVISLDQYLKNEDIAGISGVDTRHIVKKLSSGPPLLAKLSATGDTSFIEDDVNDKPIPNLERFYQGNKSNELPWILLIDCGSKRAIVDLLLNNDVNVVKVDHRSDYLEDTVIKGRYDAIFISNGPGNPKEYGLLIENLKLSLKQQIPMFGICLGHQVLALAAGSETYLLDHAHRSHNQPIINLKTKRCYSSSQNHSYAVVKESLSKDWEIWFENLNDQSIEGLYHKQLLIRSVQFHPEGSSGPQDLSDLVGDFLNEVRAL